ncbi:ATPase [Bacteroidia bacterium]|nr:ATPase [Bacteroidia bacterium]
MENKYINRLIDNKLIDWKNSNKKKPLLLRGARQVGKSSSVRHLAESFEHFVEINFEKKENLAAKQIFERHSNPQQICDELSMLYNKRIEAGKTLLFLDEIQACPDAISALRFFYEDYPDLHVVAAGSLLEFALAELPSFGVGRIETLFMFPLSFAEFLNACGADLLCEAIQKANPQNPLPDYIHKKAIEYLKKFLIIGGMPEITVKYVETQSLFECSKLLSNLTTTLKADFSKYKKRVPELRLNAVFNAVANQMGEKFVYSKVMQEYNNKQVKECLELLRMAGLVIPVVHSSANGLPIGSEVNLRYQKFLFLDTGIYQNVNKLDLSELLVNDDFEVINKGSIAELYAGLELIKAASNYSMPELYCWVREEKNANAQVDYLVQKGNRILPVEIKSGKKGSMQSLHLFMKEKNSEKGIRSSLENFGHFDKIDIYPLYAINRIV